MYMSLYVDKGSNMLRGDAHFFSAYLYLTSSAEQYCNQHCSRKITSAYSDTLFENRIEFTKGYYARVGYLTVISDPWSNKVV